MHRNASRLLLGLLLVVLSGFGVQAAENPAVIPVPQPGMEARHTQKVAAAAKEKFDLLLIGDSITHGLETPRFKDVWKQFYEPRHTLNLGYSGARTENILWNLKNGEIEGQSPKAAILMIGTNNADEQHFLTNHNGDQIGGGIEAIVKLLREKLPTTKIVILRCFPFGANPSNATNVRNAVLCRASDLASRLADGKQVFYADINHVFLNLDGTMNRGLMPDCLHPTPAGAKLWGQAMEPLLSSLLGDASRDTEPPANTAVVPAPKLEKDGYDWYARHEEILKIKDQLDPEVVLIGDSITHFWAGEPKPPLARGPKAWAAVLGKYRTLNLGFGWDRTQNVLWRLDHGELDRLHPRAVVVHIGTNNTSGTKNARQNTPAEIAEGVQAVCLRIRSKAPQAKIILMAVFPREEKPTAARRAQIAEVNRLIAPLGQTPGIELLDIGPKLLQSDGTLSREVMSDFCHPTEQGYQVWADALAPLLSRAMDGARK